MGFWWKRYEPLLEQKPQTAQQAMVDIIAKEMCELLQEFPPPLHTLDFNDPRREEQWSSRWAELKPLSLGYVRLLLKLVRLDLEHDNEQIDWMLRNNHHRDAAVTQLDVDLLWLLWPTLVEFLYTRKDDCQGHLKRGELFTILDKAEQRFARRSLQLS